MHNSDGGKKFGTTKSDVEIRHRFLINLNWIDYLIPNSALTAGVTSSTSVPT